MSGVFVGCISCGTMLVMSVDTDGQGAARAGWRLSPSGGWECPIHAIPVTASELLAQPVAAAAD